MMHTKRSIIASVNDARDLGLLLGDSELSHCLCSSNCLIHANQHSFDASSLYRQEQGVIAGINIIIQPPVKNNNNLLSTSQPFDPLTHSECSLIQHGAITYDEMTIFLTERPGSPPDLTGSKSSKASSFQSSSLSSADTPSDFTNFEDIGLGEDLSSHNQDFPYYDNSKRPLTRTASTTMNGSIGSAPGIVGMRDLTNGTRRPSYPNLQVQVRGAGCHGSMHSFALPHGGALKKGFASPSSPSLAMRAMSNLSRSRSPSPSHFGPTSPRLKLKTPSLNGISRGYKPPIPKRRSWQPNQKSVKELEDEYDDLDEELPEDASLWNVPLSPRPPPERTSISAANSVNVSPNTSPERSTTHHSTLNNVKMTDLRSQLSPTPHTNQGIPSSHGPMPSSLLKPRYHRGISSGTMTEHFYFPKSRAKTWDVALSELSEEAKYLTEALENHAGALELQQEVVVQNGALPARSRVEKLSRAKTSSIELPPLRISDVMIDPLPVSKEKEKVLSRTRPSWLPPKNRKEEKKHLREYQHMMELSREAEKRKVAKAAVVQCAQDDTKSALLLIWEEHVLPNWAQVICEPRTRELWWRGVAPRSRGQVWERAIGNDLALTETTYTKALQRAKDMETRIANARSDERIKETAWFAAIRRDIHTVFPDLKLFQHGSPLHDGLVDVLMAYCMYRSDVGYSHGTHFLAALLVLILPNPKSAFLALANLLNRPLPLGFLTHDPAAMNQAYALASSLLARKLPRLHSHLFSPAPQGLGLVSAEILEPMMRTFFLAPGGGVGLEAAVRMWDVMVFEGDDAVVEGVVGVLAGIEAKLYGGKKEVLGVLGWGGEGCAVVQAGGEGGVENFMAMVRNAGKEEGGDIAENGPER